MFDINQILAHLDGPQRAEVLDDQGRPALVLGISAGESPSGPYIRFTAEVLQDGYKTVARVATMVWQDGTALVDQDGQTQVNLSDAAKAASWAEWEAEQLTAEGVEATAAKAVFTGQQEASNLGSAG